MSEFKMESRVGFNDDDLWNVQLRVSNILTRDEAVSLGQAFAQQFQDFITSRGGTITKMTSPVGSEIKPGLALPPDFKKMS